MEAGRLSRDVLAVSMGMRSRQTLNPGKKYGPRRALAKRGPVSLRETIWEVTGQARIRALGLRARRRPFKAKFSEASFRRGILGGLGAVISALLRSVSLLRRSHGYPTLSADRMVRDWRLIASRADTRGDTTEGRTPRAACQIKSYPAGRLRRPSERGIKALDRNIAEATFLGKEDRSAMDASLSQSSMSDRTTAAILGSIAILALNAVLLQTFGVDIPGLPSG